MKTKKTKEAISLIVLVLTIVIMIILAGVIILNLSNSGIIDKADAAVQQTNLAEINELASIGWALSYGKGARTEEALRSGVTAYLLSSGIEQEEIDKYRIKVTTKGVKVLINDSPIIPEGAVYYVGDDNRVLGTYLGEEFTAGERMPEEVLPGDVYVYDGYEYRYGCEYYHGNDVWSENVSMEGWGVAYIGDSTKPNPILESINGVPIVSLKETFARNEEFNGSSFITSAPLIPAYVTDLSKTFFGCSTLHSLPDNFTIPSGVTSMDSMFEEAGLSSLPAGFTIPEGVTNIQYMFMNNPISSLPAGFAVPKSVKQMDDTFKGTNLSGSITIHATPSSYSGCFEGTQIYKINGECENKEELLATSSYEADPLNPSGIIPEGATYNRCNNPVGYEYGGSYYECIDETYNEGDEFPTTSQKGDTYIYNGYKYVYEGEYSGEDSSEIWYDGFDNGWGVLYDAWSTEPNEMLETINGKPILTIRTAFYGSPIVTAPAIPETVIDMDYAFAECTSLTTAPVIPSNVDDISDAFYGCSSLTGTITINSTPSTYNHCFSYSGIQDVSQILGSCENKQELIDNSYYD